MSLFNYLCIDLFINLFSFVHLFIALLSDRWMDLLIHYSYVHSFIQSFLARYCDPLPTLNNGRRTCTGSRDNIYGSVCTHVCSAGYKVNGPDTVTCKDTKQWDKSAPSCKRESYADSKQKMFHF